MVAQLILAYLFSKLILIGFVITPTVVTISCYIFQVELLDKTLKKFGTFLLFNNQAPIITGCQDYLTIISHYHYLYILNKILLFKIYYEFSFQARKEIANVKLHNLSTEV